jgi:hypothetical protein
MGPGQAHAAGSATQEKVSTHMAATKAATKAANKAAKTKARPLPKGFKPARTRLDGFFEREPGNTVIGILRGSFEVRGKFGARRVYRIELTEGETQVGDGEVVEKGGVIGIDETGYTKALGDVEAGSGVFVRYEGKEGEGEKAPHIFTVGVAE